MNPIKQIEKLISDGNLDEARALTNRLGGASNAMKLAILASIEQKAGEHSQAELLYQRALKLNPDETIALLNLGKLYLGQKKNKSALPLLEAAHNKIRNEQTALVYAAVLSELDRMKDAANVLLPLVEKERPSLNVLIAYCSFIRADLRPRDAIPYLEKARALYPDAPELEKAQADTVAEMDPSEAQRLFREGADHATVQTKWNRSFVELRLRAFDVGWDLYENGLSDKIGKIGRPLPHQVRGLPMVTDLESLDPRKWTLFSTEQGIGDQVLFLGTLNEARERVERSALVCEQRMIPILQRSYPGLPVYSYSFALNLEKQRDRINGIFPIGSLQKTFRKTVQSFEKSKAPYLAPNQLLVEKYRGLIQKRRPGATIVGLSWTGGFWDRQQRTKSLPFEALVMPFLGREDVQLVCLQYGDVEKEKEWAKDHNVPISFIAGLDFRKQTDNWFSLGCACDYVVSVSTALVHFMGAAGKRVELLLTDKQAPFIWGIDEGASLPYPSVNIHRRRADEENDAYMNRIRASLLP